jgi:O-antigen ligase
MKFKEIFLFLIPVGLVGALYKITLLGYPLYLLEGMFVFFVLLTVSEGVKNRLKEAWNSFDRILAFGLIAFLVGAMISTLLNPISVTSLGQLKSWFIFPAVFFLYTYSYLFLRNFKSEFLYKGWLCGMVIIAGAASWGYMNNILTYDQRLAFPYSSGNFLAFLLAPASVLLGYFCIQAKEKKKRYGLILLLVMILVLIYHTHSYNTWIALFAASFSILYFVRIRDWRIVEWKHLIIIGIILFLGASLVGLEKEGSKVQNLFLENGRSSLDSRIMIWQSAEAILKDHWVQGVGVGNFQKHYLLYQPKFTPYLEWAVPQPHNIFLAVWLQTGLLGLLGFAVFLIRVPHLLIRKCSQEVDKQKRLEGAVVIGLWVLFLSYGLLDTPYFRNDLAFIFWLQVLLSALYLQIKKSS